MFINLYNRSQVARTMIIIVLVHVYECFQMLFRTFMNVFKLGSLFSLQQHCTPNEESRPLTHSLAHSTAAQHTVTRTTHAQQTITYAVHHHTHSADTMRTERTITPAASQHTHSATTMQRHRKSHNTPSHTQFTGIITRTPRARHH